MVHYPRTRSCRRDTAPTKSYNPSGPIQSCEVYWSQDELDVFRGLGVPKEKRESTYLAAYLSCWLCVFALPETKDWLIHPETFETASLMASGCKFSLALAVPVLASLYHGLNGIAYAVKPSYSRSFFSCHYLFVWLAHYFQTHHMLHPSPLGPLMVWYSGPLSARGNMRDVRKLIHEG